MFTVNSPFVDFDSECDEFYNNSCFKLQSDRKQWTESERVCNDIGGYLTSIHSENENEMLANHVKIHNNNDPNAIAWIGLDYGRFNQLTTWLDGSLVTFTNNYTDTRSSGCMIIISNKNWFLDRCDAIRQFICRKTGEYFFLQYVVGHQ